MPWFAVKTFYRTYLVGRPNHVDSAYQPGSAIVEERIVLFEAKNANQAIKRAQSEAKNYSRSARMINVYEQKVMTECLGFIDCHETFEPPGDKQEVFSACELTSSRESKKSILSRKTTRSTNSLVARQFMDHSINAELEQNLGPNWAFTKTTRRKKDA